MSNALHNKQLNLPLINIIGAGIIGKTLAKLITHYNCGCIGSILNSTPQSTKEAIKFIKNGNMVKNINQLEPADITIIATPEDMIETICKKLCSANALKPNSLVMHCSGIANTDVLQEVKKNNCFIARLHIIKHFYSPSDDIDALRNTFCTFDGDESIFHLVKNIFTPMGANIIKMNAQNDCKYHAACVLVTSYPQVLILASTLLFQACGMEKFEAITLSRSLIEYTLKQVNPQTDLLDLVVGPVGRADVDTIQKNLDSIDDFMIKEIYQALGKLAVRFTRHDDSFRKKMLDIFINENTLAGLISND